MNINAKNLLQITESFHQKKVLVIGDLILDEFIWGKVKRISPEAPVPVVEVEKESLRLGGSANVVNNLNALGACVALCGVIGNDGDGKRLLTLLNEMDIDSRGVIVKDNRPTAIKTRVIAQHQQIVRFDREKAFAVKDSTIKKIHDYILDIIDTIDAVVISDYGKGVISEKFLSPLLPEFSKRGIPVAVDPKPLNFPFYQGVTVITPNHHEASLAAGMDTDTEEGLISTGTELLKKNDAKSILITRGENGMALFEKGKEPTYIDTMAKDVYDVTGAGDTVIATMALALAGGADLREASILANHAAGIVVGKLGTATTTVDELKYVLLKTDESDLKEKKLC